MRNFIGYWPCANNIFARRAASGVKFYIQFYIPSEVLNLIVVEKIVSFIILETFIKYQISYEIYLQFLSLSDTIYTLPWYNKNQQMKKMLYMMIIRGQSQKYLSGGGIIDINMITFGSVRISFQYTTN